jgi:hypothetical protein
MKSCCEVAASETWLSTCLLKVYPGPEPSYRLPRLHTTLRDFVRPSATFRDFGLRRCATLMNSLPMIVKLRFTWHHSVFFVLLPSATFRDFLRLWSATLAATARRSAPDHPIARWRTIDSPPELTRSESGLFSRVCYFHHATDKTLHVENLSGFSIWCKLDCKLRFRAWHHSSI